MIATTQDHNYPAGATCPHFGECGGCQQQDSAYPDQVAAKSALLGELFGPFWQEDVPVTPSPVLWHYRNKVDPSFSPKRYDEPPPKDFIRETVLGFKKRGRWFWPLEIEECRIGPAGLDRLFTAVRAWYHGAGLRAFDSRTGEGFLRCLLVRDGKRTGERMVVLITCPGTFDAAPFAEAVQGAFAPTSLYRGIFSGSADVAMADELELLAGSPTITERLCLPQQDGHREIAFRISPFSFFQTNTLATERLYSAIRMWLAGTGAETLYDLYGGAGGIAFTCADCVKQVISVENVPEASEDGRYNAAENGITNVEFVSDKVKNFLKWRIEGSGLAANPAVAVDPPRAGLHPKAVRRLVALRPKHLLYVSCNPKILAREIPALLEVYRLTSLQGFDLFPHTRHVEVVAAFETK